MSDNIVKFEENGVQLAEIDMTEEQLEEKKLFLMQCKLEKDNSDNNLREYEAQLDKKIPSRLLDDSIKEMEKDIEEKKLRRQTKDGEIVTEASEADLDLMKIRVEGMKILKEQDIPMRDLRLKILLLKNNKKRHDAPENQIKKLEKEIRERRQTIPASRLPKDKVPKGVG